MTIFIELHHILNISIKIDLINFEKYWFQICTYFSKAFVDYSCANMSIFIKFYYIKAKTYVETCGAN
jgi:hypothetical protein